MTNLEEKETTLLDSSLNTVDFSHLNTSKNFKKYDIKVIDCNGFKQLYVYEKHKVHKISNLENNLKSIDNDNIVSSSLNTDTNDVLFKNVMRSKIKLQRLAKCNADYWKTFVTLTFKENIQDLSIAYKKFRNFIISIKKVKKDFKWLCVPEYQKSGRVHYHLITNIDLSDNDIIVSQVNEGKVYYHTKQWSKNGFDLVESVEDKDGNDTKKICGYISKYMSKSYIDNSFFNHNRYYCSQNLIKPIEIYLDLENSKDLIEYQNLINDFNLIYDNEYKDIYDNPIHFIELKKQ